MHQRANQHTADGQERLDFDAAAGPNRGPHSPIRAALRGAWNRAELDHDWRVTASPLRQLHRTVLQALETAERAIALDPAAERAVKLQGARMLREIRATALCEGSAFIGRSAWLMMRRRDDFPNAVRVLLPLVIEHGRLDATRFLKLIAALWARPEEGGSAVHLAVLQAVCRRLGSAAVHRAERTAEAISNRLQSGSKRIFELEALLQAWDQIPRMTVFAGPISPARLQLVSRAEARLKAALENYLYSGSLSMLRVSRLLGFLHGNTITEDQRAKEQNVLAAIRDLPPPRGPRRDIIPADWSRVDQTQRVEALLDCIPRALPGHTFAPGARDRCRSRLVEWFMDVRSEHLTARPLCGEERHVGSTGMRESKLFARPAYQHVVRHLNSLPECAPLSLSAEFLPAFMRFLDGVHADFDSVRAAAPLWQREGILLSAALFANERATFGSERTLQPLRWLAQHPDKIDELAFLTEGYAHTTYSIAGLYRRLNDGIGRVPSPLPRRQLQLFCDELADALLRKSSDLYLNALWIHSIFSELEAEVQASGSGSGICDRVGDQFKAGRCRFSAHYPRTIHNTFHTINILLDAIAAPHAAEAGPPALPGEFRSYSVPLENRRERAWREGLKDSEGLPAIKDVRMKMLFRPYEMPLGGSELRGAEARANFELLLTRTDPTTHAFHQPGRNAEPVTSSFRLAIDLDRYYRRDPRFSQPLASLDFGRNAAHGGAIDREGELVGNTLALTRPHGNHDPEAFTPELSDPAVFAELVNWLHDVCLASKAE